MFGANVLCEQLTYSHPVDCELALRPPLPCADTLPADNRPDLEEADLRTRVATLSVAKTWPSQQFIQKKVGGMPGTNKVLARRVKRFQPEPRINELLHFLPQR